ncbi:hypothetical protein FGIG_03367 [Fasciola gigantica]|uniref:Uncharacterized protein n=1 Tax=Fasciola gigantica TaxID=46835 RepID=A0A504YLU0_FASGI|nr:hypothetical protein FGIG_03367 [Fasciola gigantica]
MGRSNSFRFDHSSNFVALPTAPVQLERRLDLIHVIRNFRFEQLAFLHDCQFKKSPFCPAFMPQLETSQGVILALSNRLADPMSDNLRLFCGFGRGGRSFLNPNFEFQNSGEVPGPFLVCLLGGTPKKLGDPAYYFLFFLFFGFLVWFFFGSGFFPFFPKKKRFIWIFQASIKKYTGDAT